MNLPRTRGYFGIGAEGVSKSANVGALLRTAHAFGASFCFTLGAGFDSRAARSADTSDTALHVPLYRDREGEVLPLNAAYVLGPERASLSAATLAQCRHVVRIPTRFSLNLAVAGALVLYDRLLQHGRFAERPAAPGGGGAAPHATGHGHPVFRRTRPAWMPKPDADEA